MNGGQNRLRVGKKPSTLRHFCSSVDETLPVVTMMLLLDCAAVVAGLLALRVIWTARRHLAATTLLTAWRWAFAAIVIWIATLAVTIVADADEWVTFDQLWYTTALLGLTPAVAALGAKRPGIRAWTGFVILPMLAVLGWPMLTVWASFSELRPLRLETPALIGIVLVLLMGAGNYVGTKYSLSAALYALAICLAVTPASGMAPKLFNFPSTAPLLATTLLGLAIQLAAASSRRSREQSSRFDQLWDDYRNTFGIVWGKRLQERINGVAVQQKWAVRLEDDGFLWDKDVEEPVRHETEQKLDETLRWLLRRFVDPPWIDERLGPAINKSLPQS